MSANRYDITSVREALSLLGLHAAVDAIALKEAFRAAVKSARPDQPGGDSERFRRIIAAYRFLQASTTTAPALAAPDQPPPAPPVLAITPMQAMMGAVIDMTLGERKLRVTVPAGMRTGEHVRLKDGAEDSSDLFLPILIRAEDDLSVLGDDLFMTWPVTPRVLQDGGRIEIETHKGTRSAWITPGLSSEVQIRLRGLGLPERDGHPLGNLFVSLKPSEDVPSSAEDLLLRFTRVWTPERLAA